MVTGIYYRDILQPTVVSVHVWKPQVVYINSQTGDSTGENIELWLNRTVYIGCFIRLTGPAGYSYTSIVAWQAYNSSQLISKN